MNKCQVIKFQKIAVTNHKRTEMHVGFMTHDEFPKFKCMASDALFVQQGCIFARFRIQLQPRLTTYGTSWKELILVASAHRAYCQLCDT